MVIDVEYLHYKIKGLPVARVIEITEPFDWFGVLSAMGSNYIMTWSEKGCVGLIFPDKFLLIPSFRGTGEVPIELPLVGIADELPEELKMQMHYMGLYYG